MEEVSAPGPEGPQEIINRWKPFNHGESPAAHLEQLYPATIRMSIEVRAKGKGEKYVVSIPTYAYKEDLKQVVEDIMLIRNRNFVQLVELVSSLLLYTNLALLLSYCFVLMCFSTGCHSYPEHDLPTPRVSNSAEGCRKVTTLRSIDHF